MGELPRSGAYQLAVSHDYYVVLPDVTISGYESQLLQLELEVEPPTRRDA